ncbi:MAG: translation initiation factor IF-2 [Bacteroidia bacterium]
MPRIAQVLKELGVGRESLQEKCDELGISVEVKNPNARISEEDYERLLVAYGRIRANPSSSAKSPVAPPASFPPPLDTSLSLQVLGKVDIEKDKKRQARKAPTPLSPPSLQPAPEEAPEELAISPPSDLESTPSIAQVEDMPEIPPTAPTQVEVTDIPVEDTPMPVAQAPHEKTSEAVPSLEEKAFVPSDEEVSSSETPTESTPSTSSPFYILGKVALSGPPPKKKKIKLPVPEKTPVELQQIESIAPEKAPTEIPLTEKSPQAESQESADIVAKKRRKKRTRRKREDTPTTVPASTKDTPQPKKGPVKVNLKASGSMAARKRFRQEKKKLKENRDEMRYATERSKILEVSEFVTVAELANALQVGANEVIGKCIELGYPVSINQRLEKELVEVVAEEFGMQVRFVTLEDVLEQLTQVEETPSDLVVRSPIVTVMGHVDHGKTTLLDTLRKTNVVEAEAGGITQHVGAYEVQVGDRKITFLDTPGHEAFTAMRARGARVTDIAVIVVAADDHVRPQTVEAINHAQAAGVPMVIAINKIDKDTANPDRIRQELADIGVLVEEWGGSHQSQEISAKKGMHVEALLEKILLQADLMELRANPHRPAKGTVIEAQLDKGKGPVATVIVQTGTLQVGDVILAGKSFGRVRALFDDKGRRVKQAGPSQPVQILGFNGMPQVGDRFYVLQDETTARQMAGRYEQIMREYERKQLRGSILEGVATGQTRQLNLIVKGDVIGSVEALSDALLRLSNPEVQVNVIHRGAGQITDGDILLAKASNALVIGFQVRMSPTARSLAKQNQVEVRLYNVIYDAIDDIKSALAGMLPPLIQQETVGIAEVREIFKIPKIGTVAGCKVTEGKITRGAKVHVLREGVVVYSAQVASLRRFKEDVREVVEGYECGITVEGFQDFKQGDLIEAYEEIQVKRTLS